MKRFILFLIGVAVSIIPCWVIWYSWNVHAVWRFLVCVVVAFCLTKMVKECAEN